jgi:hypothetical protein
MAAGRFAEARAHLNDVTNTAFADVKHRLERNLAERENAATNTHAATVFHECAGLFPPRR